MEQALVAQLLASAALSVIVGRRITWSIRNPAQPLPAVVLHKISGRPDYTMAGPSGVTSYLVQMDCLAATAADAVAVQQALSAALGQLADPFRGVGFVTDERADFAHLDAPDAGRATDLYRQSLDVRLWLIQAP